MDQLPSNSHNQRREPEEPKKVEKIVVGEVVVTKKPWFRRAVDGFFAGRADIAAGAVVTDVVLPAARNAFLDAGNDFLFRLVNGNDRTRAINTRAITQSVGQYVNTQLTNYNSVGKQVPGAPMQNPLSYQDRSRHDFGRLKFQTRIEAQTILNAMHSHIQEYNAVTVSDLYGFCGITADFTDDNFGWVSLPGASVMTARGGGYYLNLPVPIVLD